MCGGTRPGTFFPVVPPHDIIGTMFLRTFALSLALCASAFAQATTIDIPYQKFVLDNGLTVIVHEDHKAPIVAVNIWYHVGSKNEKPGKTGFAHLFEHLMFGGSENFHGRYIDAMERVGATDLNGTTNDDRTNYFEDVPTSALDYTLWLESDRMGHLLGSFDEKTLDLQRGVVQNEKRQGENQPYGVTRATDHGEHLSRRASIFMDGNRLDGRSQCRLHERREGVVPDLLRPIECGAGAGGRYRLQHGQRKSRPSISATSPPGRPSASRKPGWPR